MRHKVQLNRRRKVAGVLAAVTFAALAASYPTVKSSSAQFTDTEVTSNYSVNTSNVKGPATASIGQSQDQQDNIISWARSDSAYASGYQILRAETANGTYEVLATVSGRDTTSYTDVAAWTGKSFYKVRAVAYNWISPTDSPVIDATTPPPGQVTNLVAVATETSITLNWSRPLDATSYKIYRQVCIEDDCSTRPLVVVNGATTLTYTFDEGYPNARYTISVSGVDRNIEGAKSAEVVALTVPAFPPQGRVNTLTADYGKDFELYEQVKFTEGGTSTSLLFQRRESPFGETTGEWKGFTSNSIQNGRDWTGRQSESTNTWGRPKMGYDYDYRAVGYNSAGQSSYFYSGIFRIPWFYGIALDSKLDTSNAAFFHRAQNSTTGNAVNTSGASENSGVVYSGPASAYTFKQPAAFRPNAPTDRSVLLNGPGEAASTTYPRGAGFIVRANSSNGTASPPALGNVNRSWVFSYKKPTPGTTWPLGKTLAFAPGSTEANGWHFTTGGTTSAPQILLNGTAITNASQADARSTKLNDGEWHQVIIISFNSTTFYYEDGALKGSRGSLTLNTVDNDISLGGLTKNNVSSTVFPQTGANATSVLPGFYDEWRVSTRAMSGTQIAEHYAGKAEGD